MMLPDNESNSRIQTICLMVLAVVSATFSIYWLRPVLVPLVVALFVVSGVSPLLVALEKRLGVTRIVAAGLTFLAGLVALLIFGLSIRESVNELSENSDAYLERVDEILNEVEERFDAILNEVEERVAHVLPSKDKSSEESEHVVPPVMRDTSDFVDTFLRDAISLLSQALINLISTSVLVLIFVFFLLIGTPSVGNKTQAIRDIDQQIRSYLSLKTVISIFTGLAFGLTLRLFGVPMAFTFGVLAFLLNFVPNIGPIVACLLPVPLIILDPERSVLWMVSAISVTGAIQLISGNIVEPKIMGESSDLHPVTILLALMFWGMMWGVIGMFLATPITAALRLLLQRIDSTRPIASLMAGRLTEVEDGEKMRAVV